MRRTSQLANQLLALSRADARSLDAQPLLRVDLKDLCETLLEAYLDAAEGKQIDLGLEVEDNGPGVPPAQRLRVFERFYRVPGTATDGNGLGLAIANEIARVPRSELVVTSGLNGQGTRVTLAFLP